MFLSDSLNASHIVLTYPCRATAMAALASDRGLEFIAIAQKIVNFEPLIRWLRLPDQGIIPQTDRTPGTFRNHNDAPLASARVRNEEDFEDG